MTEISILTESNFNRYSLDTYVRTHNVRRVYRRQGTEYVLVDLPYTEDWSPERKRMIAETISGSGYITYLALENGRVIGFVAMKKQLTDGYMILDMMHVSAGHRGNGLGRRLFDIAKAEAAKAGAKALYISACSSEETIAFYMAMGAFVTPDPIKEIADDEPFDLQMICRV